jgi:hypothetical protein
LLLHWSPNLAAAAAAAAVAVVLPLHPAGLTKLTCGIIGLTV